MQDSRICHRDEVLFISPQRHQVAKTQRAVCPRSGGAMLDIFPPGCLARSLTPRPPLPAGEGELAR